MSHSFKSRKITDKCGHNYGHRTVENHWRCSQSFPNPSLIRTLWIKWRGIIVVQGVNVREDISSRVRSNWKHNKIEKLSLIDARIYLYETESHCDLKKKKVEIEMRMKNLWRIDFLEVLNAWNDAICDLGFVEEASPDLFAEAANKQVGS